MLAGGLTADNVGDAIRRIRPWGVDVATGVESSPGRKDPRKLRRFIQAAHAIGDDVADDERPPAPRRGSVRLGDRRARRPLSPARGAGTSVGRTDLLRLGLDERLGRTQCRRP